MSKVYVTQLMRHMDMTQAEKFGDIEFLTTKEYQPHFYPEQENKKIVDEIMAKMDRYEPGTDYIMTTGSAIPNVIVGMVLDRYPDATHQILKWSNRNNCYELFNINT